MERIGGFVALTPSDRLEEIGRFANAKGSDPYSSMIRSEVWLMQNYERLEAENAELIATIEDILTFLSNRLPLATINRCKEILDRHD